jgi:putative Mn2+ efflux pump MntP
MGYCSLLSLVYPLVVIGVVSSLMTAVGLGIGVKFGKAFAERLRAELWGGIILIVIGIKVLVEHLSA